MIDRLPCGCRHNGKEWVFMCEPCRLEFQERHERAAAEHKQAAKAFRRLM